MKVTNTQELMKKLQEVKNAQKEFSNLSTRDKLMKFLDKQLWKYQITELA